MGWGQNAYNLFISDAGFIVMIAMAALGIYFGIKREFSKMIGFLIVMVVAAGLVFATSDVKDVMVELFKKVIGKG